MKTLNRKDYKNKVEYSLHLKTLLMIRQAINHKYPTMETIITLVSILMQCKEYEMTAGVLESEFHACISENRYICCKEFLLI